MDAKDPHILAQAAMDGKEVNEKIRKLLQLPTAKNQPNFSSLSLVLFMKPLLQLPQTRLQKVDQVSFRHLLL